jgi:hypothetical protein
MEEKKYTKVSVLEVVLFGKFTSERGSGRTRISVHVALNLRELVCICLVQHSPKYRHP